MCVQKKYICAQKKYLQIIDKYHFFSLRFTVLLMAKRSFFSANNESFFLSLSRTLSGSTLKRILRKSPQTSFRPRGEKTCISIAFFDCRGGFFLLRPLSTCETPVKKMRERSARVSMRGRNSH
jgi:hypothetical protein